MIMTEKGSFMLPAVNGSAKKSDGIFKIPRDYAMPGYCKSAENVFAGRMARIGSYRFVTEGKAFIRVRTDQDKTEEEYDLEIGPEEIRITVSGNTGYKRALETLFLLAATGNGSIPCSAISDAPRFAKRAVMLDCCRHFFSVEEIKRVIEQASIVHMNMFHWHLSDDQGYRIESRRFPKLNEVSSWRNLAVMDPMVTECGMKAGECYGGFYTRDDIARVVEYAAERGVDVVPEIDVPGHSSAILSVFNELTCSGAPLKVQNTFGVHQRIFCAGKEETFRFLFDLIDEIASMFPSKYFHLGGDEAPKAEWKICPHCRKKMAELKYTSYEQLQCYFTGRLAEHLKGIGKTPICWNESAISGDLAPEAIVQYWAEMGSGESYCAKEAEKERKFILSNCDQFYCTDSYAAMSLGCTLMFEPNVKGIPIPDENVYGLEMPMWTEWTPTSDQTEPQMYPRLLAAAECGWAKEKNEQDHLARAKAFLETPALNVMKAPVWEKVDIRGEAALDEIALSLVMMGKRYHDMAAAETQAGGEAGVVAAVEPDDETDKKKEQGAPSMDPTIMIRAYVAGKMTNGFTEEDIDKVAGKVVAMMGMR